MEYRTRPTRIVGERFHIYVPKGTKASVRQAQDRLRHEGTQGIWSRDLAVPHDAALPAWMIELAEQVGMIEAELQGGLTAGPQGGLPTGVIVGSAVIEKCTEVRDQKSEISLTSDLRPLTSVFAWHLAGVERAKKLRKPRGHPQPVWFQPF